MPSSKLPSAFLVFAAAALLASAASAQNLVSFNGKILAANGDTVPGLTGVEIFGGSSTFDSPVIDDMGNLFFRGRMTGGTTTATTDRAFFYGSTRSGLNLVLRSGDPEPSGTIAGATLNTATGAGINGSVRSSANGFLFFGASLTGGSVTTANDTAYYVGLPGAFSILVREGDVAVGTAGATYSSSFSAPSQQNTGLNALGRAFFLSNLSGGDVVGTTNNVALYTGTPGNLVMVLRKGDLAPGGEQIAGVAPNFVTQMNASGQIAYDVSFVVGTGTPPVTAANDRALWIYTPGTGNQQIVREGDATGIPGVTFGNAANNWTPNTGSSTFNASGQMLIRSDLAGAVTANLDDSAIYAVSTAGHTLVARRGDAAPGLPGVALAVFNNTSLQYSDSGRLAFQSSLSGAVTTTDDTSVVAGTAGNLGIVAREGNMAPGSIGFPFGNLSGLAIQMSGQGHLQFNVSFVGTGAPFNGICGWNPAIGLFPVVTNGDQIEVRPGVFKPLGSGGGIQFSNGDTRPLGFLNDGTLAIRLNFDDNTGAIATMNLSSITGRPSLISANLGGTHSLYLNGGLAAAGQFYAAAGSLSGTAPGFAFGPYTVPLNPDDYFLLSLNFPNTFPFGGFQGVLDAAGHAVATLTLPPGLTGIAGLTASHAFVTIDGLGNVTHVSGAVPLMIAP